MNMKKINVAEILKTCPKGMELDCSMYNNIVFDRINDGVYPITVITKDGSKGLNLTEYGCTSENENAKCVIYPKGKTTWDGFQRPFKDGDILAYTSSHTTVFIYRGKNNELNYTTSFYVGYTLDRSYYNFHIYDKRTSVALNGNYDTRFATEEEKEKLFKAIKDNGYRWNTETKTLEKLIIPTFKVGDRIRHKTLIRQGNTVTEIKDTYYILDDELALPFIIQDAYELVPNKFDISSLKPFNEVLVRYDNLSKWTAGIFSHTVKSNNKRYFIVNTQYWEQCIPYKGNEHLVDTTDECDEYFKNW